jgi:alanine racemase
MPERSGSMSTTRAVIDLAAIEANVGAIRHRVGPHVEICATVKANAYGHGALPVAETCLAAGASMLAVATPEEAWELRDGLPPETRIMLFGGFDPEAARDLVVGRIEVTIGDSRQVEWLTAAAADTGCMPVVHVNVDTGMGRVGVLLNRAAAFVCGVAERSDLRMASVYSHFPASDEPDRSFAREQIRSFNVLLAEIRAAGVVVPQSHLANSGAILDLPEADLDLVRPGIMLYGLYPTPDSSTTIPLRPAMRLVSRLVAVREVPAGWTISYGRTFRAPRNMRVGVVPVGYADGLSRRLSGRGWMGVAGTHVPVLGRVCMDLTMIDLSDLPDVDVSDEVTVYSNRQDEPNSVEAVARLIGTIPYEVVCAVSSRVARVYEPRSTT